MSNRGKKLREVSEQEEQAIREEYDDILVRAKDGAKKMLHLSNGERETLCNSKETRFSEKTFAMYPPGYKPICRRCAEIWRRK